MKTIAQMEGKRIKWGTKTAVGLLAFIGVILLFALITAVLIDKETVSAEQIPVFAVISVALASFLTNIILLWNIQEKVLPIALLGVGGMLVILLISGMLFFDGITGTAWSMVFSVILGSIPALVLNLVKANQTRFKKYHSR